MSDDRSKVADKAGEIARNIWLAGVGAYGKAVDEAQDRLEKAGVEPPKLFKDLVKAGAALEEEARGGKRNKRSSGSSVEERINRVRENLNLARSARGSDIESLHRKLDALNEQLGALLDLMASGAAEDRVQRKPATPAKRKATARSKPAAKPATKKPTARKAGSKTAAKARVKAPAKAKSKTAARRSPARGKSRSK